MRVKNKSIIVTGAGSGIGAVITTPKSLAAVLGSDKHPGEPHQPCVQPGHRLGGRILRRPADRRAHIAKFLARIPLGRFSTALDVANAVLELASDEAPFIGGVCLEVDGARCV